MARQFIGNVSRGRNRAVGNTHLIVSGGIAAVLIAAAVRRVGRSVSSTMREACDATPCARVKGMLI